MTFVDTGYLIALARQEDALHERAAAWGHFLPGTKKRDRWAIPSEEREVLEKEYYRSLHYYSPRGRQRQQGIRLKRITCKNTGLARGVTSLDAR
jgi:hypothetical protein